MGDGENPGTEVFSSYDGNVVEEVLVHYGVAHFGSICQHAATKSHIEVPAGRLVLDCLIINSWSLRRSKPEEREKEK
jgi:hypothetical protein